MIKISAIIASLAVGSTCAWYKPAVDTTWHIQFTGSKIDMGNPAKAYDIDGFNITTSDLATLKREGHRVICYFSAGSIESYVPDAQSFPEIVRGNVMDGWPDERWLDIRRLDVLEPLMSKRASLAKSKGCDAIDWDNVDGYTNDSGFPLTGADQVRYNLMLSRITHARDMAVGLKNDLDQIAVLVSAFDFAVNEQCVQYNECKALLPFIKAGKPVFGIEYSGMGNANVKRVCGVANGLGFRTVMKGMNLGAAGVPCWSQSSSSSSSSLRSTSSTSSSRSTTTLPTISSTVANKVTSVKSSSALKTAKATNLASTSLPKGTTPPITTRTVQGLGSTTNTAQFHARLTPRSSISTTTTVKNL